MRVSVVRILGAGLATVLAAGLASAPAFAAEPIHDPRSHELLRLDCVTGNLRTDLTLFSNGTCRLREGEVGSERMHLSELDPDAKDAYVRRLQAESLGESVSPLGSLGGEWTESCRLAVDIPDGPQGEVRYGNLAPKSLALSRVVTIAEEILLVVRTAARVSGLRPGFVPQRDQVLVRRDGTRYRVRGLTSDGLGIELEGIDQPVTIYFALEVLHEEFLEVEGEGGE